LLAHGRWFSPGTPVSSTTKTGCHDIAEILLKVALSTKNQNQIKSKVHYTIISFIWGEHRKWLFLRGLTTWCLPHMKVLTVFTLRCLWLECFVSSTTKLFRHRKYNYGTGLKNPDCQQIFHEKHKLSYYFYIVKHYVTYYNTYCL
jgi:hypothetical protein